LTLPRLKRGGFFLHREAEFYIFQDGAFTLQKLNHRMPYGFQSSNFDYLSGCDIAIGCIPAMLTLVYPLRKFLFACLF
jgi:hypothetical protein